VHALAFDIDWTPLKAELSDTVLLPVLPDQYGRVLERGELRVEHEGGRVFVRHFEGCFPLGPKSLLELIASTAEGTGLPDTDPDQQEIESLRAALSHMPDRRSPSESDRRERHREKEVFKRRLERLLATSDAVAAAFRTALERLNGVAGDSGSFDALDRLLSQQSYRLASWRVASQEINYRRFFDVNTLVAAVSIARAGPHPSPAPRSHGRTLRSARLLREPAAQVQGDDGHRHERRTRRCRSPAADPGG
jgi:(1->4)-alpha-D-glucan 1-alpha-D-glucosylmutase